MNNNFNIDLGKKIREIRKKNDISLTKLASKMDVSYQQLQKYETGTNRISAEKLFQIAEVMRLQVEYFFPDNTIPSKPEPGSPEHRIAQALSVAKNEDRKRYIAEIVEKIVSI